MRVRRTPLRALLTGVAALIGSVAAVVIATPAHAVHGLVVATGWSTLTGSESFKSAVAICPAGTKVLGGGADIVGGGHEVRLISLVPAAPGLPTHSYYAVAMEDGGYSADWTMYAWATCGSGVTGWQVATNSFMVDENASNLWVFAECPAGKVVIGVGGAAIGGYPYLLIGVHPDASSNGAWAGATGDESTPIAGSTWGAWSYAICVNPVAQRQVVSATAIVTSQDKQVHVVCPAGTKLHSAGASLSGASGEVYFDRISLYGRGIFAAEVEAHEDQTGAAATWSTTIYAVCAA